MDEFSSGVSFSAAEWRGSVVSSVSRCPHQKPTANAQCVTEVTDL